MPNAPPATHSMMASSRNCFVMSRRRAPSDLRRPISRMRSVTLVSIMFMMPMPPTNSEMDATEPMSSENDVIIVSICLMTASSDDTYTFSGSRLKYCATKVCVVSTSRSMSVPSRAKPTICWMPLALPMRVSTVV